ncbi:MFS transporter [Methanomethylovorans sp.]|uniref:MFS transporter n=1 Tax=Methanomethylovorans sp. TaxID=2758717 RepID=UPI003D0C3A07
MKKERFLVYASVFLIMGLSNAVIPVLPELASRDHAVHSALASSLLFSAYFIGAFLTMLPFGLLSDRYGKKKLIVFSMFLTSIAGIMLVGLEGTYCLTLARLIEGTACGAFFPSAYSLLSEYKEKTRFFGELNFLLNAGLAAGVVISGYLAQSFIKGGILLFTIFSILLLFIGLRDLYYAEKVRDRNNIRSVDIQTDAVSDIKSISFRKNYLIIWSSSFLLFGVTGVVLALYPDYSVGLLSKTELSMAIAGMYASSMITNIIAGRLHLHHAAMFRSGLILAALGTTLAVYFPIPGFILVGTGSGIGLIGLPVAVSFMKGNRGLLMGIFNTYTYAGMGFMPIIAGALIPGLGFRPVFFLCSLALCLPVFMKYRVESESKV